jgi:hypothetical protein
MEVDFDGGTNEAFSSFLAPPSLRRTGLFDQPVLQYVDGNSTPIVFIATDAVFDSTANSEVILSGYLLDCVTPPCAAIAQ